ncbi:hypothetical protein K469DRAFT_664336 [Zopfia rhizophila CBS 207.26]|uniref:dihydroneopterin aldolase n=1 Tax=Zopfia rhizophila CBS 207.26 TaxID=1314779 RepID=A0A6A6E5W4_9PEZI|nr:hypothetical protein K469DRAFT_664336 [Zopfia rhizophila CBS 207.26]
MADNTLPGDDVLSRYELWQRLQNQDCDKIVVRNLEATINAGVDAWGRKKAQPALLTISLALKKQFDSAAQADSLDSSTIHYGKLSKNIRAAVHECRAEWMTTNSLALAVEKCALEATGPAELDHFELDVFYPKGSMLGDGAGLIYSVHYEARSMGNKISRVLYLRNVRIPCLIGVNANERQQKQPVIVNLWLDCHPEDRTEDYPQVEDGLVKVVSESSFETLESLSTMAVQKLKEKFARPGDDRDGYIRMRVEKPMAVPFAEAPAIEISRPLNESFRLRLADSTAKKMSDNVTSS